MLMHLMDGRKFLNLSLPTLLFRGFLRFLFLFTLLYILKKAYVVEQVSLAKKTVNLTGRNR